MSAKLEIHSGDPTFIKVPGFAYPIACGTKEFARRIIACVNALEGVTTEELESGAYAAAIKQLIEESHEVLDTVSKLKGQQ